MSTEPTGPASNEPIRPQVVRELPREPVRVVVEQPKTSKFGRRVLWTVLIISLLFNLKSISRYQSFYAPDGQVEEKFHSLARAATDKIAIITVEGVIASSDGFVKRQIDAVRADKHVKAVVLRINSPGGTVTASDAIYHYLKEMADDDGRKLPIVVSMGGIAASGGYYIAMAVGDHEKVIYAEPTTWTGSIGVIIPHYDLSGLLARWDVNDDSIASGPLKQMGSPTRKLPEKEREEERKILKELVDQSFDGFKKIVLGSRAALRSDESVQANVFSGRIFTAPEAKKNGLVDELGFIEAAIERAVELAKLDKSKTMVVKYVKPANPLGEALFGADQARSGNFDLSALLDLTAPRAYYLCTWLPGVALSPREQ